MKASYKVTGQICLEGPKGWEWFRLGNNITEDEYDKIERLTGSRDPQVIDVSYDDDSYEDIFKIDGWGYTLLSQVLKQYDYLNDIEDYDLPELCAYMRTSNDPLEDAVDAYMNHMYIRADSTAEDLARECVADECDEGKAILLAKHFDYAALGEELELDDYESPNGYTDAWSKGEEYVEDMYGSIEDYIAQHDIDNLMDYYFDYESYGRDLAFSHSYDENTGFWVTESFLHTKKLKVSAPAERAAQQIAEKLILKKSNSTNTVSETLKLRIN